MEQRFEGLTWVSFVSDAQIQNYLYASACSNSTLNIFVAMAKDSQETNKISFQKIKAALRGHSWCDGMSRGTPRGFSKHYSRHEQVEKAEKVYESRHSVAASISGKACGNRPMIFSINRSSSATTDCVRDSFLRFAFSES